MSAKSKVRCQVTSWKKALTYSRIVEGIRDIMYISRAQLVWKNSRYNNWAYKYFFHIVDIKLFLLFINLRLMIFILLSLFVAFMMQVLKPLLEYSEVTLLMQIDSTPVAWYWLNAVRYRFWSIRNMRTTVHLHQWILVHWRFVPSVPLPHPTAALTPRST